MIVTKNTNGVGIKNSNFREKITLTNKNNNFNHLRVKATIKIAAMCFFLQHL